MKADRKLLGLGRGDRSDKAVDLSLYRPWFLRACASHPRALKCFMVLAILLSFVVLGPFESVWRLFQEVGRACRNFSFYRAKKVWTTLPRTLRTEMAGIDTVRNALLKAKEAN